MKLRVKHSRKYLALDKIWAVQKSEGEDWKFYSERNEINPKAGEYGRIILTSSSSLTRCLQPSSMFPQDGWLITLSPIQEDNDSQFWRFIPEGDGKFYIIENKNEQREKNKTIKACMDVCEEKTQDDVMVITYHVKETKNVENQRWEII